MDILNVFALHIQSNYVDENTKIGNLFCGIIMYNTDALTDALTHWQEKEEALNQEIEKLRSELQRQQQQQKKIIDEKLREIQAEESGGKDSAVCTVM